MGVGRPRQGACHWSSVCGGWSGKASRCGGQEPADPSVGLERVFCLLSSRGRANRGTIEENGAYFMEFSSFPILSVYEFNIFVVADDNEYIFGLCPWHPVPKTLGISQVIGVIDAPFDLMRRLLVGS